MKTVELVIFDLGNVLVHIDHGIFWRLLGLNGESIQKYYEEFIAGMIRYECGMIGTEDFTSYNVNLFENRFSAEQLRNAAVQIIGKPIEGMSEIVQQVGKKRKTALLSNTNPLHYDYSIETIPALNAIPSERHFVSFKLGILKPNMGIFRKVIELTNVPAGQIFFVDDSPENVSGAQGVGIRASQFKGVDDLKRELIELGVI